MGYPKGNEQQTAEEETGAQKGGVSWRCRFEGNPPMEFVVKDKRVDHRKHKGEWTGDRKFAFRG